VRLRDTRIRPLPAREVLAIFPGAVTNDLATFLIHPDLVKGVLPFANYIANDSTLTPRHRSLLILRTAWLANADYLWARHSHAATVAGLTAGEMTRIAHGPDAAGWDAFEATLLRAADELHRTSFISDDTWKALDARYDTHALMDAVFTVAEFTMLAGTMNSLGVPIDEEFVLRMPTDIARPRILSREGNPRGHVPLASPRIPPLAPAQFTPDVRQMLDPSGSGRPVAAVYRTFAQHPKLYPPRQVLSEYIRLKATLPPRVREMLILRIGYLCGSEYEWAAHARAGRAAGLTPDEIRMLAVGPDGGWSRADAAVVRAVDELFAGDEVSGGTWGTLAETFNRQQLLDLLITTGGYRMVSMALNTFGVPLEPGSERFPVMTAR
jgi:alkylhydroperoxidase family enzyme